MGQEAQQEELMIDPISILRQDESVTSWKKLEDACGFKGGRMYEEIQKVIRDAGLEGEAQRLFQQRRRKLKRQSKRNWLYIYMGLAEQLGRNPTRFDLRDNGLSATTFQRIWGSLHRLQKVVQRVMGYKPNPNHCPRKSKPVSN